MHQRTYSLSILCGVGPPNMPSNKGKHCIVSPFLRPPLFQTSCEVSDIRNLTLESLTLGHLICKMLLMTCSITEKYLKAFNNAYFQFMSSEDGLLKQEFDILGNILSCQDLDVKIHFEGINLLIYLSSRKRMNVLIQTVLF